MDCKSRGLCLTSDIPPTPTKDFPHQRLDTTYLRKSMLILNYILRQAAHRSAIMTVELSLRQLPIRRVVDRAEPDIENKSLIISILLSDLPRGVLDQALVSDDERLRQLYIRVVRGVLSLNILLT